MKIALAQIKVIPNQPEKNLETMLNMIEEAKKQKVDLIAFPEMCIGGYLFGDKWLSDEFCKDLMEYNDAILEASNGIAIAYGNIFVDDKINDNNYHPNKDGRTRKYNAVYVVQNGKPAERLNENNILPKGIQPKTLLPNYRFFDDERYFFSSEDIAKDFNVSLESLIQPLLIEVNGNKIPIGFEVCEDLWCEDYRKNGNALNPTKILIDNKAKLIVNISASPWTYGKNSARDRRIQFLKKESKEDFVPFLYVNCTGVQNNGKNIITFDGGSTVYNKNGLPIIFSKAPYKEELIVIDEKDFDKSPKERIENSRNAQKYKTLIEGIRHFKDILGLEEQPKYVIGLSGGIDSAVAAALLTLAVGKDKVLAVNMPTKYNSDKTKRTAEYVAEKLGITYTVVSIEDLVNINQELLDNLDIGDRKLTIENLENVQAKIRATNILSNIAAMYNALFVNTGNKLEIATGYATLYGDVGGAYSILGDLNKTEIFDLSEFLNKEIFHDEVIPEILFPDELFRFGKDKIIPSAELRENQVDPIKYGYHCALLDAMTDFKKKSTADIMQWYLNGELEKNLKIYNDKITPELIRRYGLDDPEVFIKDLEWFDSLIQKNVFKRIQSPPIIVTSKSAYGYDIRESLLPYRRTKEHERLKKEILSKVRFYKPLMEAA